MLHLGFMLFYSASVVYIWAVISLADNARSIKNSQICCFYCGKDIFILIIRFIL